MLSALLTVIYMHVGPQVLSLANHTSASAVKRGPDDIRHLDRMRVLNPQFDKSALCNAIDRRRQNDIRFHITYDLMH